MRSVKKGATSQSVYFEFKDSTSTTGGLKTGLAYNTASLVAYYVRNQGSATAITLATLSAANSAWSSGGFKEVDSANMPGVYRLDVPDAAFATGVDAVVITVKGATGMVQASLEIQLVDNNSADVMSRLGTPAGASVSADVAAVKTDTAAVKTKTDSLTFTVAGMVDSNVVDWKGAAAPAMTGDAYARLGAPAGASVSADVAAVKAVLPAALVSGRIDASVGAMADGVLTAAAIAADAITDAKVASDVTIASVTGAVGSVTGNVGGNVTGSVGSVAAGGISAASIATDAITAAKIADGAIDSATFASGALDAVWSVATRVLTAGTNIALAKGTGVTGFNDLDAAGVRGAVGLASANLDTQIDALPTNAELAIALAGADDATLAAIAGLSIPTVAAIRTEMDSNSTKLAHLDADISSRSTYAGADTSGTTTLLGRLTSTRAGLLDNLDAAISTRSTFSGGAVASVTGNIGGNLVGTIGGLSVQAKADVNAEADTALADVGVTSTVTGRIDAAISTRLPTSGYTAPLDAAGTRGAVGLASANLDTQLDALPTNAELATALSGADDATLAAIAQVKAKTDLIPGTIDGKTFAEIVTLVAAVLLGKASGMATTTARFRSLDDAKDRIVATVDANGNRSAVTLDPS